MSKGIDSRFVHYGIRREDLSTIEGICETMDIDFEWLKEEILRAYHAKKVEAIEVSDSDTEDVIRAAINKIRQ